MTDLFIAFGDWTLRHNEPLPAQRARLSLRCAPANVRDHHHSLLLDLRGELAAFGEITDHGLRRSAEPAAIACANLAADELPLAVVALDGEMLRVTHLLTRVEKRITHLIKAPHPVAICRAEHLIDTLREGFEVNHLYLNNFECYYIKGMPDTELEQKFNIAGEYDYHVLNRQWYAALDDRRIGGFAPQLGDEIQHWSYDNDFCRIQPNPERMAGYVSIMHWSRVRKSSWDDPVVTYKKKLYREDALERWERNYADQRITGTPEESMASFFKLPLSALPSWRRTRCDMACEAVETGNIFMINFEDSRVRNDNSPQGRLQQCEIEYLKTRGQPDERLIYADLARLNDAVDAFMLSVGLVCERTNYSKLTFLEEYVREHQDWRTFNERGQRA
ncbi:hypothetical protein H6CHR_04225 [Variovorax sp. PBL-H6]|uniref:hypothetical protein n=1 Tax=Variovorax sp. PBL-H6 TaxID=434009 RepID=UPI0013185504|nr:hypothetical protein [Variovorax sp. PBL-H6]VTU34535.1 hypothetical protein H6CHR_04225 [Variovorax sp. PBL-H6]